MNPPPNLKYEGKFKGLKGEVFNSNGLIAGCIPPLGQKDAIKFTMLGEYPGQFPRWVDMLVSPPNGEIRKVRINPDICEFPFSDLWQCVFIAAMLPWNAFSLFESDAHTGVFVPPTDGKLFLFTRAFKGTLLMIDTYEHMKKFAVGEPIDEKYINTDILKNHLLRSFPSSN